MANIEGAGFGGIGRVDIRMGLPLFIKKLLQDRFGINAHEFFSKNTIASTHPPVTASNLTPGTNYQFEVRVLSKNGWSDWGGAVTRFAN